jgi:hypothetical protein
MTTKLDIDYCHNYDNDMLDVVLPIVRKYEGIVDKFIKVGPGGGNPNIQIVFPTREQAENFYTEFYEINTDDYDESNFVACIIE